MRAGTEVPTDRLHIVDPWGATALWAGGLEFHQYDSGKQWLLWGNSGTLFLEDCYNNGTWCNQGVISVDRSAVGSPSGSWDDYKTRIVGKTVVWKLGVGTDDPEASIHVRRFDGTAQVRVEEGSPVVNNTRRQFFIRNNGSPNFAMSE